MNHVKWRFFPKSLIFLGFPLFWTFPPFLDNLIIWHFTFSLLAAPYCNILILFGAFSKSTNLLSHQMGVRKIWEKKWKCQKLESFFGKSDFSIFSICLQMPNLRKKMGQLEKSFGDNLERFFILFFQGRLRNAISKRNFRLTFQVICEQTFCAIFKEIFPSRFLSENFKRNLRLKF